MTRIKIRLKSGKWISAKAFPTSSPHLFITPERERSIGPAPHFKPSKRGRFIPDLWTVTHRRSGYSIVYGFYDLSEAKRLGELFAQSSIPWEKIRSKKSAKEFSRQHRSVIKKFYAGRAQ